MLILSECCKISNNASLNVRVSGHVSFGRTRNKVFRELNEKKRESERVNVKVNVNWKSFYIIIKLFINNHFHTFT